MSDIRKFFTPSQSKRPASPIKKIVSDERKENVSPKNVVKKQPKQPAKSKAPIIVDDEDSDFECPVSPSSLNMDNEKKEKQAVKNSRRIILESSDEEEYFDESTVKSPKHEKNVTPKRVLIDSDSDLEVEEPPLATKKRKARVIETPSPAQPKKSKRAVIESSDEDEEPQPKKKSKKVAKLKEPEPMDVDIVESSDEEVKEEETKAAKKSRKSSRRGTPPNQQKIDALFFKKVPSAKGSPKNLSQPKKVVETVDPFDFFNSFKSTSPRKKQPTPLKEPEVIKILTKPLTPKNTQTPIKMAEVVDMTNSDDELEIKKTKVSPQNEKSATSKKVEIPPKKQTPVKTIETKVSKEETFEKLATAKKEIQEKAVIPKVEKISIPTPPPQAALPALPTLKRAELPWVDKYKPMILKDLIGQSTPVSPTNKLLKWLNEWAKNNLGNGGMQKKSKPAPFMAQNDGTAFKAALISGPPGIGKTTSAVLVCKELGLKYVEMNASDARNKKLLDEKIVQLLENRQINEYFIGENPTKNVPNTVTHVLIMDEVDGMSGNQDRSGISELISMIKSTKIPIICICNDRQSPKIRSLANYCFDLRFQRPNAAQIKGRLMTLKTREKVNISFEIIDKIIEASNQDVRQCIYSLQLYASGAKGSVEKKDISVNIFEGARKMLSKESIIAEKLELYFGDYSIMPLFVQENYPNVRGEKNNNSTHLTVLRRAASCIAEADLIDKQIRSNGAWNLLPEHGMLSSVVPAMYLDGHLSNQLQFPSWLGKNSSANKRQRMMRQLASHAHLKITGTCYSIVTDYLPILRNHIYKPLIEKETEGVREVIDIYKYYDLTRDDTEAINELAIWPGTKNISQNVNTKTKSALTRNLNKESRMLPYSMDAVAKGKKKAAESSGSAEMELDEEGHVVERKISEAGIEDEGEDDEDEKENDDESPEIKVKITKNEPAKNVGTKRGRATTSARGGRGRGRGKA